MKIVIATANAHKAAEIRAMLEGADVELLDLGDFPSITLPAETGSTFAENACAKARYVARSLSMPALADDSGLVVDALGGRPGIYSSRYAGPGATDAENVSKLLGELKGVEEEKRTARFFCAAALALAGGETVVFEGALEGRIAARARGDRGFGYDPVFIIPDLGRTAAELDAREKNRISHRARALAGLRRWLEAQQGQE